MKFWFILWFLGLRMAWLGRNNPKFRELLVAKDIVLQFQTRDGRIARHYIVRHDKVTPVAGRHSAPTTVLNFRDAAYAAGVLMSGGKDPMAFMKGVQSKDIVIEGDMAILMWFMAVGKYLPPGAKP